MKHRNLILISFSLVAVGGLVVHVATPKPSSAIIEGRKDAKISIQEVKVPLAQEHSLIVSQTTEESLETRRQIKDKLSHAFQQLQMIKSSPSESEKKDEYLSALITSSENVTEFQRILTNLNETKKLYGNEQAIARINSIEALGFVARSGNFKPLEETIDIERKKIMSEVKPISQGQIADFSDSLYEWIRAYGKEKVAEDFDGLLERFQYHPKLKEAFATAIWNVYGWTMNESPLKEKLAIAFKDK